MAGYTLDSNGDIPRCSGDCSLGGEGPRCGLSGCTMPKCSSPAQKRLQRRFETLQEESTMTDHQKLIAARSQIKALRRRLKAMEGLYSAVREARDVLSTALPEPSPYDESEDD